MGWVILPSCWFSLNNSETVKAATLAFCSIQLNLIGDVRAKFGNTYSPQSPDIGENSGGCISNFRISGQSLIKTNCHNSWTSDDIGMKLGPETKLDKRNKNLPKKIWRWCPVLFWAIWKPYSRRIVCKTYIFINYNFLSYKNWQQNQKIFNTALALLLWVKVLFWSQNANFLQKMLTSAKLRGTWYEKLYFLDLNMNVYLRAEFQVSSVSVSFRQGVLLPSNSKF